MPLIGPGQHSLECNATAFNKTTGGNPQVVLGFIDEHGNTINAYLSCSDAALPYTVSKLAAAGWNPEEYDFDFSNLNAEDCALVGMKEIPVTVVEETYEGKTRPKVSWIGSGGVTEKMPEDEAKVAAADIRRRLIALKGSAPAANTSRSAPPAPPEKKIAAGGKKTW